MLRSVTRHWLFTAFLCGYCLLLIPQLQHGVASVDGHGAIRVTRALVNDHQLDVSRPPGHPTTEYYFFGSVAWLLNRIGHIQFSDRAYLICQAFAGLATLVAFYGLLMRLRMRPWPATLATLCLALSPQFFANTVDGEEFVIAILFLILALRCLIISHDSRTKVSWLALSALCFALATGCRPEAVFAGVMYPIYWLLQRQRQGKDIAVTVGCGAAAMLLVWFPVFFVGARPLYTAGMNARESILGGAYRLVFQCFTPPVFLLFCIIMIAALRKWPARLKDPFPGNFLFVTAWVTPIIFFAALFLHASKAAHVLFVVPFIVLLALTQSRAFVAALALLTLIGFLVSLDIFKDRRLVSPYLVPGSYFQAVSQKPYYKLPYLKQVLTEAGPGNTVLIVNAWPWDLEYHVRRGTFPAREERRSDPEQGPIELFFPVSNPNCIILPHQGAFQSRLLERWQSEHYLLKMDRTLYRTLFQRYNVTAPRTDHVQIGAVSFRLFYLDR